MPIRIASPVPLLATAPQILNNDKDSRRDDKK
jgi:hypothetical protein